MSDRKLDQSTLRAQFIAWLNTKDPTEYYSWSNPHKCACGQFAASFGQTIDWFNDARSQTDRWMELNAAARKHPRNFGHLLYRLTSCRPH
jgi:hypothetical protein